MANTNPLRIHLWHGFTWYFGEPGILERLVKLRDANPAMKHMCLITSQTKYRLFAIVDPKYMPLLLQTNKGIYEIIEPKLPRKVYFDVDKTTTPLQDIKDRIRTIFPDAQFAISGNKKLGSYHILLTNYHYKDVADMQQLKAWCHSKTQHDLGFDPAPYSRYQQFKCVNQSKPNKDAQLRLEGPRDINSHLVQHVAPESKDALEHSLIPREPYKFSDVDVAIIPQSRLPVPESLIDFKAATPLQVVSYVPNAARGHPSALLHAHTLMVMCYAKKNGLQFTDFWAWAQTKDNSPHRLQKYIDKWADAPIWAPKSKDMQTLLERFYPGIKKPKWTQVHKKSLQYTPDIVAPCRYMSPDQIPEQRYVALGHGMGGNKTGAIIEYLESNDLNFIWITPRITLAKNTHGRFKKETNVQYYKSLSKKEKINTLKDCDRLMIGGQSLHYLEEMSPEAVSDKVIIIDEVEFVMCDWMNETHEPWRDINWKVFLNLLRNCKKCIVMDAFLSNITFDFMKEIGGSEFITVNRAPIQSPVRVSELYTKAGDDPINAFITHIADSLNAGKNCFVFYPYKNTKEDKRLGICAIRDTILQQAQLEESDSLCYFADTDDKVINGLANVNVQWKGKRLVITNSTITVGVNYDQSHFDVCYIAKAPFNSPREIAQVSARVRHLNDNQIYLMYLKGGACVNYQKPVLRCPIFAKLQENFAVEFRTRGSHEICNTFFDLAGYQIDHSRTVIKINEDTFKYVLDCDMAFKWHSIGKIMSQDELDTLQNRCYTGEASQQDKLMLDKHNFLSQFASNADPDVLRQIWDNQCVKMVYKHAQYLKERNYHILKSAYTDLGIVHLSEMWKHSNKLSLATKELIFDAYNLHTFRDDSDYVIMSNLLSTYYGYPVLVYDRDRKVWSLDELFVYFTEFVVHNVEHIKVPEFLMLD